MVDLSKPIRTTNGAEARYLGHLPNGLPVISWLFEGKWNVTAFGGTGEGAFENIPDAPPHLEGYLEVYSRKRQFSDKNIVCQHEDQSHEEVPNLEGEDYWLTIDLSKVPPGAIVKVAP